MLTPRSPNMPALSGAHAAGHQSQEGFWENYPELLGRVLSHLEDEERCNVAPRVCHAWLRVHKSYPPHRTEWQLHCDLPGVVKPMVTWFLRIAGTLEELKVDFITVRQTGLLSHMLRMAADSATKLRRLSITWIGGCQASLQSLSLLSQITHLDLSMFAFPRSRSDNLGLRGLTGLRSLEVLNLREVSTSSATASMADLLWTALASLPALRDVKFATSERDCARDAAHLFVISSLSLVTQISALQVTLGQWTLGVDANLVPIFDPLTQLTALTFKGSNGSERIYAPCLRLPLLKKLKLGTTLAVSQHVDHDGGLLAASHHLTSLSIEGSKRSSITGLISMDTPALPLLHTLEVNQARLHAFPEEAATRLKQLVVLRLQRNKFARLPPAVALIPTLQELDLSGNRHMQLRESDVTILSALSSLTEIDLSKGESDRRSDDAAYMWTAASMQAALLIGKMFPQLSIQLCSTW